MTDQAEPPKLNRWGYESSPPLTDEQTEQAIAMLAGGTTMAETARKVGCTYKRILMLRQEKQTAERLQNARLLEATTNALPKFTQAISSLIDITAKMEVRCTHLEAEMRKMNKAIYRKTINVQKLETERANLKKDLIEVKRQLWKRTGIDWKAK